MLQVGKHPNADALYLEEIDVGDAQGPRQVSGHQAEPPSLNTEAGGGWPASAIQNKHYEDCSVAAQCQGGARAFSWQVIGVGATYFSGQVIGGLSSIFVVCL